MKVACTDCGADVYPHEESCIRCCAPQGFPNIRAVGADAEREALAKRAVDARLAADNVGAGAELARLVAMAETAPIAFNRNIGQLYQWCKSPDQLFHP